MLHLKEKWLLIAAMLLVLILWCAWGNGALQTTQITFQHTEVPAAFDGFRIAQVSDFHDAQIGKDNRRLVDALKNAQPDIIVLTGDMIDCNRPDMENTLNFVRQVAQIAPTYYVNGNHEALIPDQDYRTLIENFCDFGVTVLEDECICIERDSGAIRLIGLNDIGHLSVDGVPEKIVVMQQMLKNLLDADSGFSIVLSHRPELIEAYAETAADLVFSGHAHGGQVRLPYVGGLIAPGQGIFPQYDSGLYTENETNMIVSRGIGNSRFPIRINNRPEIIITELKMSPLE